MPGCSHNFPHKCPSLRYVIQSMYPKSTELNAEFCLELAHINNMVGYTLGHQGH